MASFKEMPFTPAEFAAIAKIDRTQITELEKNGLLRTVKRRVGNVDRKMITLENMQEYFRNMRVNAPAGAMAAGNPELATPESVAAATARFAQQPKHKKQMFYNVK